MFCSPSRSKILHRAVLIVVLAASSLLATTTPAAAANTKNKKLRRPVLRRLRGPGEDNATDNAPFYIQQEEDAFLVAVIDSQYGGDDEDDEKIRIPCNDPPPSDEYDHAADPSSTGPGVIICQDNGNGHYELRLPFRFVRSDEDGTIVGVEYDTVQTFPFRTVQDGTTITGIVSDIPDLEIPFYTAGVDPAEDEDGSESAVQQQGSAEYYGKGIPHTTNKNGYNGKEYDRDNSMIVVALCLLCLLLWACLFCRGLHYKKRSYNKYQDNSDNEEIVIEFYKCDGIVDGETDDDDDDDGATSTTQDE